MLLVVVLAVAVAVLRVVGDRPPRCTAAQLTPTLLPSPPAADGQRVWHLGVTNWFGPTCLVEGYLAVDAYDYRNHLLARARPIEPEDRRILRLRPSMSASSRLSFASLDARTNRPCRPAASFLRVGVPNGQGTFGIDLPSHDSIAFTVCGGFVVGPPQSGTADAAAELARNESTTPSRPAASVTTTSAPLPTRPAPEPIVRTRRRCTAADLRLTAGQDLGSLMQQPAAYFGFANISRSPCKVRGYPTVVFFDGAGHSITSDHRLGAPYQINDPGPTDVSLAPGTTGWFGVGWIVINSTGDYEGCVTPAAIGVVPPGGRRQLRIPVDLRAGFCPSGGLTVTAMGLRSSFRLADPAP